MFRQVVDLMNANPISFGALILAIGITGNATISNGSNPRLERQNAYLLATGFTIFVIGLSVHFYDAYRENSTDKNGNTASSSSLSHRRKLTTAGSSSSSTASSRLKNIWETGESRNKNNDSNNDGVSAGKDNKPFGSKYYYAHNNPNATGGYKDGLKLEDYQMNGPRLLSKGGLPVVPASSTTNNNNGDANDDGSETAGNTNDRNEYGASSTDNPTYDASTSTKSQIHLHDENIIHINKYLWDDPGESNGIATIRIEVLLDPKGQTVGRFLDCKDLKLSNANASLAGEGLLFKVYARIKSDVNDDGNNNDDDDASKMYKYQLKIPKLYGDAADVKVLVKPKRILIRIYKKKNSFLSSIGMKNESSNLDAWPQPHRKI
jgi:hypothetical protein